jgi:hypothetical protein
VLCHSFPVYLSFTLTDNLLTGMVTAAQPIPLHAISFQYERCGSFTSVKTISMVNSHATIIVNNKYAVKEIMAKKQFATMLQQFYTFVLWDKKKPYFLNSW